MALIYALHANHHYDPDTETWKEYMHEEKQHRIELPTKPNKDKEEIAKLRLALKDARYIHAKYRKTLPREAWETIGLLLNDPKLKTKGGTH